MKKINSFSPIMLLLLGNKHATVYLLISSFTINTLGLALPLTLLQMYDRIVVNKSYGTLTWLLIGCVAAITMELIVKVERANLCSYISARYAYFTNLRLFRKFLNTRLEILEGDEVVRHIHRINAVDVLKKFYAGDVFQTLLDLPFASIFIGVIFFISPPIALVIVSTSFLYACAIMINKKKFDTFKPLSSRVDGERYNFLLETLKRIPGIKSQTMEERLLKKFEALQRKFVRASYAVSTWKGMPNTIGLLFSQGTLFSVIIIGARYVISGEMTVGGMTACMLMSNRTVLPIQAIGNFWIRMSDAKFAMERIRQIEQWPSDYVPTTARIHPSVKGIVKLENLEFRYHPKSPPVFRDVNLLLPSNQIIGMTSESDRGTSTLLLLIGGAMRPTKGKVIIDDFDIAKVQANSLRGIVEYVPHRIHLFKGTVLDNICMFDPEKINAAMATASLLGMHELVMEMNKGYQTEVDSNYITYLPKGLVPKLLLARALVNRPKILLIDNIDTAMAYEDIDNFSKILIRLQKVCTPIIATNNYTLLKNAERIYSVVGDQITLEEVMT